jgi:hypothetical protein
MRPTRQMWTDANKVNDKETNASEADEANEANANLANDGNSKSALHILWNHSNC